MSYPEYNTNSLLWQLHAYRHEYMIISQDTKKKCLNVNCILYCRFVKGSNSCSCPCSCQLLDGIKLNMYVYSVKHSMEQKYRWHITSGHTKPTVLCTSRWTYKVRLTRNRELPSQTATPCTQPKAVSGTIVYTDESSQAGNSLTSVWWRHRVEWLPQPLLIRIKYHVTFIICERFLR